MQEILEAINSLCGWDCLIKSFDGWSLCISSGTSPEYSLPLVVFSGVSYLSCPIEFSHPKFRVANEHEQEKIGKIVPIEREDFVFVIEAETMASLERNLLFLVAQSVVLATNV